jgi:hypothetical protein
VSNCVSKIELLGQNKVGESGETGCLGENMVRREGKQQLWPLQSS